MTQRNMDELSRLIEQGAELAEARRAQELSDEELEHVTGGIKIVTTQLPGGIAGWFPTSFPTDIQAKF
jgi:bacteriocin-like protein